MHTDEPREIQGVELGYDPRDIDLARILRIVVYFFAFSLVFFGGGAIWYIYFGKVNVTQGIDARKPAIVGPRVQGNMTAKIDIMSLRQTERKQMTTYEQNPNGTWRIPVDRAMSLIAQRGLPTVTSDQRAVSPGNTIPQNATGPADANAVGSGSAAGSAAQPGPPPSSTTTSPANPGAVPTPDFGGGAAGATAGGTGTTNP